MKITELIKLHSLGYTKEEIKQLIEDEKQPVNVAAPEPIQDQAAPAAQEQAPAAPAAPEPVQDQAAPAAPAEPASNNADILNAINNLTKAIQASNLLNDRQAPEQTTEDILNDILKGV